MAGKDFDRQGKGKPILAKTLNDPIAEIERLSRLSVAGGMTMQGGPGGPAIALQEGQGIWAELTSVSGSTYAWTEKRSGGTGTWVSGYLSGTTSADPARNSAGSVTLTLPLIVPMTRNDAGEWWFVAGGG